MISLPYKMGLECDFMIVNPSTFPGRVLGALPAQLEFSLGLLMANNYEWTQINNEGTLSFPGITLPGGFSLLENLDDIYYAFSWTDDGILENVEIKYNGILAAQIRLPVPGAQEPIIPGYDLPIVMGISIFGSLGLIYVVMKKKRKL